MKFKIDGKTPTVNHIYASGKYGRRFMISSAKKLKVEIIECIHTQSESQGYNAYDWHNRLLEVTVIIYENWFTKKDTIKKKDIANREKFIVDTVFEALCLDDAQIWKHTMIKQVETRENHFHSEVWISYYKT